MKKLFRDRKPSIDSKAKPAIQGHATLASTEPPLYARFSSVQRGQDNGGPTKPIVSGPMQLSSRPSLSKGSSSAAAPVLASKSKEAEKETKDMGRMPSRTSQDTQKPQIMKGSKMPNRMSQEGIRSQMLNGLSSRTTRAEERQQVVTSLPPRRSSRPLPTAPIYDDPHIAFPRMQSLEYNRSGPPSEALVAPRLDWAPTGSSSSLASDSVSYSPPLRQLVVRNFDPENDSLADSIVRPAHTTVHSPPQHVLSPRVEPGTLGVSSPLSQPAPLRPSGFDTKDQPRSPPAPSDFRDPTPLRTAPIPVNDHVPRNFDHPPALSNSLSSVPHSQPESHSVLHPSKPPPSRPQDTHRDDSVHVPTAELPVRKVSLLSTPSITRKKYSPLAAFGLSVSDANPTSNPTASTSSASIPDDKPPINTDYEAVPPRAPKSHAPPLLPTLDVSLSSSDGPLLDIDLSNWRKTAVEIPSKRASRAESATKRVSSIPSIPPSPVSPPHSQLPEIDEHGFANSEIINDTTVTTSHPQLPPKQPWEPTLPAPVPVHPLTDPVTVSSRLSASLQSTTPTYHSRALPSQPSPTPPHKDMPDVGEKQFQTVNDPPPVMPGKARASQQMKDPFPQVRGSDTLNTTARHSTDQHTDPVQGRPRIFAAMDATSETNNLEIDPRMIGLIGGVAAALKTEEAYNLGPHTGYQTPNSTPPPPPEKEDRPHRRKLSKTKKDGSARKAVPATVGILERTSSPRHGSSRTVVRNPEVVETRGTHHVLTKSAHPTPTSPPAQSGTPSRAREEPERHSSDTERHARKRSTSTDNNLHRHSRDAVKALTDKQMDKLINRKSYGGSLPQAEPQPSSSRRPNPLDQSAAYPPPPHKLSHRSTAPFIPTQTAEPVSPSAKRSHHAGQLSISHGPGSRHASPQLPTPPEEYQPTMPQPQKVRREKKPVSPPVYHHREQSQPVKSREPTPEPRFYPLVAHLADAVLLEEILTYLTFYDWLLLSCVSKEIRRTLFEIGREQVLERYLRTVGYNRWLWDTPEPLKLRVEDLCHYMRGVSIPIHQYAATSTNYLQSPSTANPWTMQELTFACRAFTRVVLRLRVQAEAEATYSAARLIGSPHSMQPRSRTLSNVAVPHRGPTKWSSQSSINMSRTSSRAPSPAPSSRYNGSGGSLHATAASFHSPLFRLRRAPLLQVFVPSPEGDWLSDNSILECEAELKRAGVTHLLRAGDVVWDVAVGDEANVGRLVWDGNYLIDLDYTYSRVGDAPRYLPTLAFSPSYFHRVIRTMGTGNPIVRVDISPWADQIQANLQLIQDRMRTENPGRHMVVRWVHRSSFVIRPPSGSKSIRLPMPSTAGPGPSPTGAWIVDPGWFGTVVVETEGTNEGLADLQARCRGPLPQRGPMRVDQAQWEGWEERRVVFRILRERSRPGEICIRVVTDKERIIPG